MITINDKNKEETFIKMLDLIAKKREGKEGSYGVITLQGLETLTQKGLEEEQVIVLNKRLTETYKHVVVSYGFEDFYSLYLYAKANTQKNNISEKKLNKVSRTIVRNGKEVEVELFEKAQGIDNKQKIGKNKPTISKPLSIASGLSIIARGEIGQPIATKEIIAVNKIVTNFDKIGEVNNLDRIKIYLDEELRPKAVQGLKIEGEYLTMPFRATDGAVQGFYQRAFYELVKVALNWELGIKIVNEGTKIQKILAETSEMEDINGMYLISYEDLLNTYGELP